ncbi:MAG: hypothetical protein KDC95_22450, partial [Planctomycetes bacterium]|nr:hypothetical protein [Planctomycetota bacterium]
MLLTRSVVPTGQRHVESRRLCVAGSHVALAAAGLVVVATIALGVLTPLYTDEVGYNLMLSRVFAEGRHMVGLLPQCRSAYVLGVPWTWLPGAAIYAALFHGTGLLAVKVAGIVMALLWLGLGTFLVRLGTREGTYRRFATAVFVCAHGFGQLPMIMTMGRSEGVLLVCLALYLWLALRSLRRARMRPRTAALSLGLFAIVTSVFFFSHSKAIFYAPLALAAAVMAFPRRAQLARIAAV